VIRERRTDNGVPGGNHEFTLMHNIATEVLPTHTPALLAGAVRRAVERLRAGDIVALPTETVYGLAANALDAGAVARVFAVKGRPAHNPVICHVAGTALARRCAAEWPLLAERLAAAFWPGPLTLVLPRAVSIPDVVTAGGYTVGIRWPAHPVMQAVIAACDFPLAAPSANLAGQLSPTTAAHVLRQLNGRIPLVLDGGPAHVGVESTVLDISVHPPCLLRPGMIHEEALLAVAGELARGPQAGVLRSPGLLRKHYSPRAPLVLLRWTHAADLHAQLRARGVIPARTAVLTRAELPGAAEFQHVALLPREAAAYARALYAELHHADAGGPHWIVVESPPDEPAWRAITDRLTRAAA